ncbi:MAG: WG repeat-containing protein, partial [Fimbriimonadaceae bacterium]
LIDRAGKQVIAFDPDHSEAFFGSGIVSILRDKRIVLIGAFGKRELDGEFEGVGKFSEGVCPVKVRREGRSDPVTIYIDESGNQALPGEFSLGSSFKEGFAIVRPVDNDSRSYLLDRSGKQIELPEHIEIRAEGFSHGLLRAEILTDRSESTSGPGSVSSNSWTETQEVWLDYKGRIVVRFQPSNHKKGLFGQRIESEFDGSLAYIYSQDKLGVSGYVDRQGKFVFIESPK